MQYRNLGNSGLKVSAIGLGTNQFGGKVKEAEVKDIIAAAIDAGVNFIDTANVYQEGRSEETIGKAIHGRRHEVVIATKVYFKQSDWATNNGGLSRKHIMIEVENSLRRLDTDHIDLYQMHRWDDETPLAETMRVLDDLITQGKVRYIGSSNFQSWQMAEAQWLANTNSWSRLVSEQPHFHMLEREVKKEILPAAKHYGMGILPYFPLAGGFFTGKYKRGAGAPEGSRGETSQYVKNLLTDANYDRIEALAAFAAEHAHTLGELAHAWLLGYPEVSSVISGATKTAHVISNAKAGDWTLTEEQFAAVNEILEPSED